ncbi:hypothetical protein AB0D38_40340, partial [Streptomyces sp. NPDC048279]
LKASNTCEMTFGDRHPAKGWLIGDKHEGIRPYFSAEPPAAHVRLSFAAVAGTGELVEGVRRLREACDEVLRPGP